MTVDIAEVARVLGITEDEVRGLMETGVLVPVHGYTCGHCQWGRDRERTKAAYDAHVAETGHAGDDWWAAAEDRRLGEEGVIGALTAAITGQGLYHGRCGGPPAGGATALAIHASLRNRGIRMVAIDRDADTLAAEVAAEGERAKALHGEPPERTGLQWLAILAEEFGEAATEVTKGEVPPVDRDRGTYLTNLRGELVQVASVAMRWLAHVDRLRMEMDR